MSMKGYGTITITDVLDGAQIWTSTTAPTSPNYTFTIANLVGDPDAEIKIGDLIFYSYYRYTVQSISNTTVLTGSRTSIRGETGAQGTSVVSIYNQYYLSTSSTAQLDGDWVENIPDYIDGRYYWSRPVTKLSNNNVVYGTPVLETSITELMAKVTPGVGMKINYSAFNTPNSGKMYIHGYSNESPADIDGCIYWNNVKRTVPKKMINPNAILPYNKYIYIVLRLSSAAATTGTLYMVWYNSGWKYAITPTPSAVGGTWNWTETTDIVLGQFIQPGAGQDVVQAYLYNPPRTASQVKTTNASPYQYSQSAVDWYNSNGGNVVNATTMLAKWADGAFSATTEINGGSIKTHTIQAKHLATNAIMSSNFQGSDNPSSPFSATGTFLDLATGNIYSPNFGIDNTYGKAYLNGEIIATSGRIGNSSATNYWEIGTKVDYNAQQSAALIGKGTAYIQVGDFQLSNGLLDTRSYDQSNQLTYPKYDNTYWDFGVQAPVLDTSTTGFVSGVDDNFIYIRKHVNTIPTLKTDWDYVFRIDKTGMIYMNDVSLDDRYALKTDVGSTYLPVSGGTITGNLTVNGTLNAIASQASKLTKTITINGTSWDGSSSTTIGTMGVQYGGTGATTFTSGYALIGNGQNAIQTRAITNNTGATYITGNTNLVTANTLKFWNGAYDTSHNSNLEYVKQGKLGTVVTLDAEDVITTDGGIIDGSLQVTDLTAGNLIVTGAARFTNGLFGDLTGNADTADKVNNNLIIKLNSGTTEGTNMFTFNGSATKTVDVTKSAVGLGNVENTKLSTWAGSANLTTTKVGTLAAAATKTVDTSISAASTSANLPTSAAVAAFVEGKGYVTSSGVTSVRVQATSPVVSSVNTAQSSTLNTTISLADGYGDTKNPYASKTKSYVLAAPSGENGAPTFRALVADDIPTLASSKVGLGNVTNNKQVKGLASGTTSNHLVAWGSDGYTVADSGITKGSVATKLTLAGTDYSALSNAITVTQANLQSAVQSTGLVLMTSAERSKLASIQVAEGGTIDFSGVTASAPLTATVSASKTVNITHNTSGVSAGTYRSVTVNTYGHVTAGTNPTTLSGYGITDAKIASGVITLGSNTITPLTASSTLDATKLSGTASISTTGNAGTATKFNSTRKIELTGDVTGSATTDGSSGWSIATTVADNSHNHDSSTILPLQSKTYTDVIGTANSEAGGQLYFVKVQPDSFYDQWFISYRVTATIAGVSEANGNGYESSEVYISGMRDTYSAYRTWNDISNTSYRPYYYHCLYRAKQAGITGGYGHAIGINLRYSYNPATAANSRTVTFEILETRGCTVTLLDAPVVYANWSGTGTTNYNTYSNFDGTTLGITTSGDRNDPNYYSRIYYSCRQTYAALYRYQLCLSRNDMSVLPVNSVNNDVGTSKALTTESFNPFGDILYWASTSTYTAGANVGDGAMYQQYLADFRYSFNIGGYNTTSTLIAREPLYLVATPQSDGTAKLYSEPLTQELPTSEDGLIYIYLGQVYPDTYPYRVQMDILHPVYIYRNGGIQHYARDAETVSGGHTVKTNVPAGAVFTDTKDLTAMTGTLPVSHGGTGKTTGKDAANYFLNSLDTGSSTPVDGDYYISQYVSGGTTTTTYHRRPMSALYSYIKGKTDSVYVNLTGTQTISGAKTFSAVTSFTNTTASTSKTTGAVKVSGGLGVAGAIHGQTVSVDDAVTMEFNTSTQSLDFIFS